MATLPSMIKILRWSGCSESQCPWAFDRIYRIEFDHLNSPVPQALKKGGGSTVTAHAVKNEIYLDTFRLFLQQQIGKFAAHFIIFNDIAFKVDMVLGILYCFEHCGIGGLTIGEQGDLVPLRQRAFRDRFYHRGVAFQHVRRVDRSIQAVHDGLALLGRQQSLGRNDLTGFLASRCLIDLFRDVRQGRTSIAEDHDG